MGAGGETRCTASAALACLLACGLACQPVGPAPEFDAERLSPPPALAVLPACLSACLPAAGPKASAALVFQKKKKKKKSPVFTCRAPKSAAFPKRAGQARSGWPKFWGATPSFSGAAHVDAALSSSSLLRVHAAGYLSS
ncbi:uncharacterized protein PSFLO_02577 [Pseudozyma flocculosa]|uniref:Secreted protein n=1 Tax=Pseudozyma flocculosa TaxID=84751 RepID=A0A5C3EZ95_9BASI|nr:uncharacterized protein PSFLO_02577 [Pseudozyma flocculosa]